jgi:hypothetical protein
MRTISARLLVLVAAFALVGAMSPAEAKHGWGNPGKHLGWYKHGWVHPGKHKGWYKHGWNNPSRHLGWYKHHGWD